jgi:hypothetical protein
MKAEANRNIKASNIRHKKLDKKQSLNQFLTQRTSVRMQSLAKVALYRKHEIINNIMTEFETLNVENEQNGTKKTPKTARNFYNEGNPVRNAGENFNNNINRKYRGSPVMKNLKISKVPIKLYNTNNKKEIKHKK